MDKDRTFYVLNTSFNQVLNINKIHPLKQEKVYSLIKNLVNMSFLKRIWIFGSSTNNSCNINSDIDVLVELENDSLSSDDDVVCMIQKNFAKSLGSNFDIVFLNDLDKTKQIYNNILKTRRLVYERAAWKCYYLEENGELLISAINEAAQNNIVFSPLKSIINDIQWLVDKSGIIIKWEQKPRYDGENFFAKEENVRKCKECLDNIISVVSEFINPSK